MIDYSPLWKTMKECGISQYTLINRASTNTLSISFVKIKMSLFSLLKNYVIFFTVHLMMYFRLKKKMIHNTVIA